MYFRTKGIFKRFIYSPEKHSNRSGEGKRERKRRTERIFCSLVYSSSARQSQVLARLQPASTNCILISHLAGKEPKHPGHLLLPSKVH